MCNACGFYCCASDEFEKCGCEGCYCSACWPDEPDEDYEDEPLDDGPYSEAEINSRRETAISSAHRQDAS